MALEPDIIERVCSDFSSDEPKKALELLRLSGQIGRVARCIVVASQGSLDLLGRYTDVAARDYRDAIMAGEYDDSQRRIRDLRVSFLVDAPEKLWIGEIACMMAARGYGLSSLTTRTATTPPSAYTPDLGEGRATFTGPIGEIEVERAGRQWTVRGDSEDLERHGLGRAFDDEQVFRDALSGYLLVRAARIG